MRQRRTLLPTVTARLEVGARGSRPRRRRTPPATRRRRLDTANNGRPSPLFPDDGPLDPFDAMTTGRSARDPSRRRQPSRHGRAVQPTNPVFIRTIRGRRRRSGTHPHGHPAKTRGVEGNPRALDAVQ